jgi:ESS family glutamate:Na+ symporter
MFSFIEDWGNINYFLYIGALLFVAKMIKEKIPFLNKIIIPSALIAGFIGLILSDGFLNLISFESVRDEFGNIPVIKEIVYHSLAIGFIALTLKRERNKPNKKIWSTGMIIVMTYLIQALVGVTIVYFFFTQTHLGAGLLLTLGFGQGPGLAFSIGSGYETNPDLVNIGRNLIAGGALGSTIASVGFLVGGTIGVLALNYLARKYNLSSNKIHSENGTLTETFEVETIKELRFFDSLTAQLVIIFVIYGLVYLTLALLENVLLPPLGDLGGTFAGVFHGFNFLIGILYALAFRNILNKLERRGKNINFITNNYILSNISSVAFNFMIAGAVLTITLQAIQEYWLLVLVFMVFGGVVTYLFLHFIIRRIYDKEYHAHYFLGFFGMLTGTASTGLALLKSIDPDFESPVAEEMVVGSGTAISMALPLFALLMFPTMAILKPENATLFNALVFIVPAVYVLILLFVILKVNPKNKN